MELELSTFTLWRVMKTSLINWFKTLSFHVWSKLLSNHVLILILCLFLCQEEMLTHSVRCGCSLNQTIKCCAVRFELLSVPWLQIAVVIELNSSHLGSYHNLLSWRWRVKMWWYLFYVLVFASKFWIYDANSSFDWPPFLLWWFKRIMLVETFLRNLFYLLENMVRSTQSYIRVKGGVASKGGDQE